MEWFALFIPLVTGGVLYWKLPHKVVWWEALLPLAPALLLIPLLREGAVYTVTADVERWGGWVTHADYYEPWNEYVHRTCTRTIGSGKSQRTETYDCSYVAYHPAAWSVFDSNDQETSIAQSDFEWLCGRFGNRVFADLHRHYYTQDGDKYVATWPNTDPTFQRIFTEHRYTNKILATEGVLGFPEIPHPQELGLYEFPSLAGHFNDPAVLGAGPGSSEADQILQKANATLGSLKQVRFWLLLFHDKPYKTGLDQESYWKGGNKNELVVCLGLNSTNQVQWCHPFCWSPDGNTSNDVLKIRIRDFATQLPSTQPVDLPRLARYVVAETAERFQRKSFKELDYISIACPGWAVAVIYVLTILTTGGVAIFVVNNEIEDEPRVRRRPSYEWSR